MPKSLMRRAVAADRLDVDLEEDFGPREPRGDDAGRDRMDATQMFADDRIDCEAIGAIIDVDRHLANIVEARACLGQQGREIGHRELGLRRRIRGLPARDPPYGCRRGRIPSGRG